MLIDIDAKYEPSVEGSEIAEGQRALETLKRTLKEVYFYSNRNTDSRRRVLKELIRIQEDELRYEKQIIELKKSIDLLSASVV